MTNFDNNEDKVCLLLKDDVGGSCIRSFAKSHDYRSCNYGVTIVIDTIKTNLVVATLSVAPRQRPETQEKV